MFSEENEEVLQRLRAGGDDLSDARAIDFTVVFSDEVSARTFAGQFAADYSVSVERTEISEDRPWDVLVTKRMIPRNEDIAAFEALLESTAAPFGGRNDGWGCFRQE